MDRLVPASPGQRGKHRADDGRTATADVFTRFAADYAAQHPDRSIAILQAGCVTAGPELDLAAVRADGHEVTVSAVDDDSEPVRTAAERRPELGSATFADLRQLSLAPRSFDIVQCSMLLHRIDNADLVLGRLVAALRPGGLLLLRSADRQTAAGLLDRRLPQFARAVAWRSSQPGQPGPFPARYEPIASARGIEAFVTRHGLAIAHRQTSRAAGGQAAVAARLVAWLSKGRYPNNYDELRYVIRKPEDRFARVIR